MVREPVATLRQLHPRSRFIALLDTTDLLYPGDVLAAKLDGCCFRHELGESIPHVLRAVALGDAWFSRKVVEWLLADNASLSTIDGYADLTAREQQVLALLLRGWPNDQIAHELHLAKQTVRNYSKNIYRKLNVHSRIELIARFRQNFT
jgi:DNA-binding NarL/FixJ family response regulator